jgi:CheY-like chemotaxis protein
MTAEDAPIGAPRIAVVADDLIWASRLLAAVQQAGGTPVRMGTDSDVTMAAEAIALAAQGAGDPEAIDREALPALVGAIVDLFGHRYDGIEAVRRLDAAGLPVVAVAQHDDQETRKLALDAGAQRVYSYNKFFQDGAALVARLLVVASDEDPS